MNLSTDDAGRLRARLETKLKERCQKPCCRCGGSAFEIFDGVGLKPRKWAGLDITQDTILVVCSSCGAITEHFAFVLDRRRPK